MSHFPTTILYKPEGLDQEILFQYLKNLPEQLLARLRGSERGSSGRFAFLINPLEQIHGFQVLTEESIPLEAMQKAADRIDAQPKGNLPEREAYYALVELPERKENQDGGILR